MEEAKQNNKQKKDSYNLRIVTAVLVLTVLILGELYVMINYPTNYVALIVLTVVTLADIYILIASAIQKNYKKEIDQYEQYDNLFKSEKASYLVTRKSFEDIADQLDRIEEAAGSPTKDIIDAQKSIAKVTISRNKENSDALMNSNDKLLEQMFNLSDRLDSLEKSMLEQQRIVAENANKDLLLKQQEMSASIKEMELSIRNAILSEIGKINITPTVTYATAPVQPAPAAYTQEPQAAEEPVAPMEEAIPEEPIAPMEEIMPEEPAAPVEEEMADLAEDDILNIDALFGNDEEAETPKESAEATEAVEEISEAEAEEAIGFDDTLGFADEEPVEAEPELGMPEESAEAEPEIGMPEESAEAEIEAEPEPEEPAFTEEMVNTIDEPVMEMNSDPNHMMTPEEIAALIANASAATEEAPVVTEDAISEESEPITEAEPVAEPVVEEPVAEEPAAEEPKPAEPVIETNSDPNHMMTPEEIAALFANL